MLTYIFREYGISALHRSTMNLELLEQLPLLCRPGQSMVDILRYLRWLTLCWEFRGVEVGLQLGEDVGDLVKLSYRFGQYMAQRTGITLPTFIASGSGTLQREHGIGQRRNESGSAVRGGTAPAI